MFGELLQRVPWLGKAATPHLQVPPRGRTRCHRPRRPHTQTHTHPSPPPPPPRPSHRLHTAGAACVLRAAGPRTHPSTRSPRASRQHPFTAPSPSPRPGRPRVCDARHARHPRVRRPLCPAGRARGQQRHAAGAQGAVPSHRWVPPARERPGAGSCEQAVAWGDGWKPSVGAASPGGAGAPPAAQRARGPVRKNDRPGAPAARPGAWGPHPDCACVPHQGRI